MDSGLKIYIGNVGKLEYIDICKQNKYGICYLANHWSYPKPGVSWFLDNGAFHSWKNGKHFDEKAFLDTLNKLERCCSKPDFIVCPDIVAAGKNSLEFSLKWINIIPAYYPVYLAVQDGMEPKDLQEVIRIFDGVFIGGSKEWKWKTLDRWVLFAHENGIPCHVGRVSNLRSLLIAQNAGANSIDSSTFVQTNNNQKFGQYGGFKKLQAFKKQTILCC